MSCPHFRHRCCLSFAHTFRIACSVLHLQSCSSLHVQVFKKLCIFNSMRKEIYKLVDAREQVGSRRETELLFNLVACDYEVIARELTGSADGCELFTIVRRLEKALLTRKRLLLVPVERDTETQLQRRAIYASEISLFAFEDLVFPDETGFNLHATRRFGCSAVNTRANRGTNGSCMCAIIAYAIRCGAYNASEFILFICEKLAPCFLRKLLVMDTVAFHHTAAVRTVVSRASSCRN